MGKYVKAKGEADEGGYIKIIVLLLSIFVSVILLTSTEFHNYINNLNSLGYLGIFIAGAFFSSIITTVPATAALFLFGGSYNPLAVGLIGAAGATTIDLLLFSIIKHRISHHYGWFDRVKLWLAERKFVNWIRKHPTLKYFIPICGCLVIASPLPDELGIAMLGASKYDNKKFFAIAFVMNMVGIAAITYSGAVLVG